MTITKIDNEHYEDKTQLSKAQLNLMISSIEDKMNSIQETIDSLNNDLTNLTNQRGSLKDIL